jgi:hypothetical protein
MQLHVIIRDWIYPRKWDCFFDSAAIFQSCFMAATKGKQMKRNVKNTMTRVIIARRLEVATQLVEAGRRDWLVAMHINTALEQARMLPDNPGNRAIRASIAACKERLSK